MNLRKLEMVFAILSGIGFLALALANLIEGGPVYETILRGLVAGLAFSFVGSGRPADDSARPRPLEIGSPILVLLIIGVHASQGDLSAIDIACGILMVAVVLRIVSRSVIG